MILYCTKCGKRVDDRERCSNKSCGAANKYRDQAAPKVAWTSGASVAAGMSGTAPTAEATSVPRDQPTAGDGTDIFGAQVRGNVTEDGDRGPPEGHVADPTRGSRGGDVPEPQKPLGLDGRASTEILAGQWNRTAPEIQSKDSDSNPTTETELFDDE